MPDLGAEGLRPRVPNPRIFATLAEASLLDLEAPTRDNAMR